MVSGGFFCIVHILERSFSFHFIFFSRIAGALHLRSYISFVMLLVGKTSFSHLRKGIPSLLIGMGIT